MSNTMVTTEMVSAADEQAEELGFGSGAELLGWLLEDLSVLEAEAWLIPASCFPWVAKVGDHVKLVHLGVRKIGVVLDVRKTRASVRVWIREGTTSEAPRVTHPLIEDLKEVRIYC